MQKGFFACRNGHDCINMILYLNDYRTQVHAGYDSNGLTACEQEQIARQILYPKSGNEMHVSNLSISKLQSELSVSIQCV